MRNHYTLIAVLLISVAFLAYAINLVLGPRILRVAVGPLGSRNVRVVVGFLQALQREHSSLRLKLMLTDGAASSAQALEEGRAELAVVRSDIAIPADAGTVAILRSDALYFLTRPGSAIEKLRDLRGKRIGVTSTLAVNSVLLGRVLTHYGIEISDLTLVQGQPQEIRDRASAGDLDAVFIVSPTSDHAGRDVFTAFSKVDAPAGILPIAQTDTIIAESPIYSTIDIPRGSFDSDPVRPENAVTTLAVTHRLVAQHKLDETAVSDLTRLLFSLRLLIARETPAANEIELPSIEDRGAKLPVHAGTIAYVEGETKTFFERFGDWFYIGVMVFSLAGSVVAAVWSRMLAARHPLDIEEEIKALLRLINEVRTVSDGATLNDIRPGIEECRTRLLAVLSAAPMNDRQSANMRFLLNELREAYRERMAALSA